MLMLNKDFLFVFERVLKYLEENYKPDKYNNYTDKFEMLSMCKPVDSEDEYLTYRYIDFTRLFDKKTKINVVENMFCKKLKLYLNNDLEQLQLCCKKAHLTPSAFKKICDEIFSPTKPCVCNLIIAAKLSFEQATDLFKSANFFCAQQNKFDVVMTFFFENELYDFTIINTTLYLLDLPMLGYYYT